MADPIAQLRRGQLVRDLCLIAKADGHVDAADVSLVERTVGNNVQLD